MEVTLGFLVGWASCRGSWALCKEAQQPNFLQVYLLDPKTPFLTRFGYLSVLVIFCLCFVLLVFSSLFIFLLFFCHLSLPLPPSLSIWHLLSPSLISFVSNFGRSHSLSILLLLLHRFSSKISKSLLKHPLFISQYVLFFPFCVLGGGGFVGAHNP